MRNIIVNESQLAKLVKKLQKNKLNEGNDMGVENYMFFSNLEQINRQTSMLMELDQNQVDNILKSGHDWAADHISEAKNNMDQVFDFMMNTIKEPNMVQESEMDDTDIAIETPEQEDGIYSINIPYDTAREISKAGSAGTYSSIGPSVTFKGSGHWKTAGKATVVVPGFKNIPNSGRWKLKGRKIQFQGYEPFMG